MFFKLKPEDGIRFGRKWAYADQVDPVNRGDAEKCPVCGRYVSGLKWQPPHRIKLSSAKPEKLGDFVRGSGFPLLVSGRFKDIYEREGLSGVEVFSSPVEIVRMGTQKSGHFSIQPPRYHLVHIPWGGASQDDEASKLTFTYERKEPFCSYCRTGISDRKQNGLIIDETTWNGSDILIARGAPHEFIVTERFKQVAEEHFLKNVWLIPDENYGYDEDKQGLWFVGE